MTLHVALAILLFYGINWLGEHSGDYGYLNLSLFARSDQAPAFNFLFKSLFPTAYLVLVSTGLYAARLDMFIPRIWLVAAYYFGFRGLYNAALGRALLLNWPLMVAQATVGTGAAYFAYGNLIIPRHPLFPETRALGNQLWVILALFIYATFNKIRISGDASTRRKNRYIRASFTTVRKQFGFLIEGQFPERYMELVAYSILIYETFNRPWLAQKVERLIFPWGSKTLGPMQVHTEWRMSDVETVRLGVKMLAGYFAHTGEELRQGRVTRYAVVRGTIAKYNRDERYVADVMELLHVLWAQIAVDYRTEFENMYSSAASAT